MPTAKQLYERAQELDIPGRSNMNKTQLEEAIAAATAADPAPPVEEESVEQEEAVVREPTDEELGMARRVRPPRRGRNIYRNREKAARMRRIEVGE